MNKQVTTLVQYVQIDAERAGQRIDNFLITKFKSIPKTRLYRLLRKGEVRVNKKRIDPSYRLQEGDEVRLPPVKITEKSHEPSAGKSLQELLRSRILFEDNHLLILNKPSGIPVHGGSAVKLGIIEILRAMFPKLPHLELAHRLDSDTSGCLILAKKRSILKELHEIFREGKVKKIYWALTKGLWKENELLVDIPLSKNFLSSGERIVKADKEGKTALTIFKTLEAYPHASLMEATLMTGRTHQIRVHAQSRKHPIAGDEKYGDREFNKSMRQYDLKRLFLHAYSIEFTLQSVGKKIQLIAPLDKDLELTLRHLTHIGSTAHVSRK